MTIGERGAFDLSDPVVHAEGSARAQSDAQRWRQHCEIDRKTANNRTLSRNYRPDAAYQSTTRFAVPGLNPFTFGSYPSVPSFSSVQGLTVRGNPLSRALVVTVDFFGTEANEGNKECEYRNHQAIAPPPGAIAPEAGDQSTLHRARLALG
jgi:hypothetical protein